MLTTQSTKMIQKGSLKESNKTFEASYVFNQEYIQDKLSDGTSDYLNNVYL